MACALGVLLMAIGLLGYTGVWRSWARQGFHFYVFGLFWFGFGSFLIGATSDLEPLPGWVRFAFIAILLAGGGGTWYMPPFMTPRWFRAMRRGTR